MVTRATREIVDRHLVYAATIVKVNDKIAWRSGTSSGGAPSMIRLKEGQTAQGEVDKWQHPNVAFFDKVDIPESILDPAKKNGLGSTAVTNRGRITKPVTPGTDSTKTGPDSGEVGPD